MRRRREEGGRKTEEGKEGGREGGREGRREGGRGTCWEGERPRPICF
jgi:hypothetical protein